MGGNNDARATATKKSIVGLLLRSQFEFAMFGCIRSEVRESKEGARDYYQDYYHSTGAVTRHETVLCDDEMRQVGGVDVVALWMEGRSDRSSVCYFWTNKTRDDENGRLTTPDSDLRPQTQTSDSRTDQNDWLITINGGCLEVGAVICVSKAKAKAKTKAKTKAKAKAKAKADQNQPKKSKQQESHPKVKVLTAAAVRTWTLVRKNGVCPNGELRGSNDIQLKLKPPDFDFWPLATVQSTAGGSPDVDLPTPPSELLLTYN
ncbi:hypothetical protein BKA67DRAFT_535728 [Truncatella angustata]|uniref:Uncharacterized protein n=1 Tax=Truncatella angustata TaxID=152316 RepID=A0A9P8ZX37_9PEZI|nr:uncharacterized protein BKA67DRAFT_535728 [Truncatella angustata]KAH6654407.1 hypothetical protein BKA67DRAFT_535728 [Truncatella angustata]